MSMFLARCLHESVIQTSRPDLFSHIIVHVFIQHIMVGVEKPRFALVDESARLCD